MELDLKRRIRTQNSTIGEMKVNGEFECYILEDLDRGLTKDMPLTEIGSIKVCGNTCIPSGKYEIALSFSAKFQKLLPLLQDVPGFEGVRIHSGNSPADTLGCLLPGQTQSEDLVGNSRAAFASLFSKIKTAMKSEKIYLTIH